MNESFTYQWEEMERRPHPGPKVLLKMILISVIVACISLFLSYSPDEDLNIIKLQIIVTLTAAVMVVIISVAYYIMSGPRKETCVLIIDESAVSIARHVTAESGRKFIVIWTTEIPSYVKISSEHNVIQIESSWLVSAYENKSETPGEKVDYSMKDYPQTLSLDKEAFDEAVAHLRWYGAITLDMSDTEYKEALPFLSKHYGNKNML